MDNQQRREVSVKRGMLSDASGEEGSPCGITEPWKDNVLTCGSSSESRLGAIIEKGTELRISNNRLKCVVRLYHTTSMSGNLLSAY